MILEEIIANQTFVEWIAYNTEQADSYYAWDYYSDDIDDMEKVLV